ncbi:acyltransferase [Pedobacter sp. SYSU D00535]|uniref:acyltransferase n=1 Tax=Pedobacter sp. SYSU D00535 TaxID=2810308 RepID=UPI001A95BF01|nr:acyltransferase [Pedobacter sp. SYSU D00535]
MATLSYLWKNRKREKFGSFSFFKLWAKRILTFGELMRRNNRRAALVKRGATIHACAEIGELRAEGSKKNLMVGAFSFIGKAHLALHDIIEIGENVCINDGVQLLTGSHNVMDTEWKHVRSPIIIDDYAWICTGAIILPGVTIGRGAVVGAGAVVSRNVREYEIVVGNPAMPIKKKRVDHLNYNPCEFLAANQAWLKS